MREWDRREVFAVRRDDDPDALADDLEHACLNSRWWFIACVRDGLTPFDFERPIALVGIWPNSPVSVLVNAIATDEFARIALPLTRHLKHTVIPWMRARGVTRAECRCLKTHEQAVRWLTMLGARAECEVPGLGKNGETYLQMAWS